MIRVTIANLLQAVAPLQRLVDERMPVKTSYDLTKIIRLVNKELSVYNETRRKLIVEMGEKREDGEHEVPATKHKEFFAELDKLGPVAVELQCNPLQASAFGAANISPDDMMILIDKFIIDGDG